MSITFGSLFSGIGGFDLGFERTGMECAWQVEIDDNCQAVLAEHWPDVERYGDVKGCGRCNLRSVDLICGGFPCQDLSVAGNRKGLAGERSGLWFEFHRVIAELEPRWVVVENVPGLLSSNGGRDFATILQGLVQLGYGVVWRVLDAQYDHLAQRRERVFIVGHLGNGRAAQVLFESEGGTWDPPPSRETGEGFAHDVAGCLASSGGGTERAGESRGQDPVIAFGGNNTSGPIDVAMACNAHGSRRYDFESETFVAFDRTQSSVSGDVSGPLRACGAQSEGVNDGKADAQCVAFAPGNLCRRAGENPSPDVIGTLGAEKQGDMFPHVAFLHCNEGRPNGRKSTHTKMVTVEPVPTTLNTDGRAQSPIAGPQYGVRRLTPTECCRLQGFPDDWNAGLSDTQRYRQLGNAVAVPVAEWIGWRIAKIEQGEMARG